MIHSTYEDHTRERDLERFISSDGYDSSDGDDQNSGCMTDSEFVTVLVSAIQSNQVQLTPRIGNGSLYMDLIKHLGNRAKEVL